MPKVVIDSDLYIDFLRSGLFEDRIRGIYSFRRGDVFFSSVVAEELLQGAVDAEGRQNVVDLLTPFEKVRRLITPTHRDWVDAGDILSGLRRKKALHTKTPGLINDTLIAVSARRAGAIVYTSNQRDFKLIAQIKNFRFEIIER